MTAALTALFAGFVAIGVTVAIERLGGRLGGVLATMPTTIVPASLGFYVTSGDGEAFQSAIAVAPVGMLCNTLFLLMWRLVPPYLPEAALVARLTAMTFISLAGWAVAGALGVSLLKTLPTTMLPFAGMALVVTSASVGAWACRTGPPATPARQKVSLAILFSRGVLAAVAVGGAVATVKTAGPLFAGLASVFPAIFLTTMVSLWWSQGQAVPASAVGPMMLGSSSVGAYAVLCALMVPHIGVAGVPIAWATAVAGFTLPAAWWLKR
jgi:hypothetical protein